MATPQSDNNSREIVIPISESGNVWISSALIFSPTLTALKATGNLPLTEKFLERIESCIESVRFIYKSRYAQEADPREIEYLKKDLRRGIGFLRQSGGLDSYYRKNYPSAFAMAERFLRKIVTPDDFTFEQRMSLFDSYVADVLKHREDDYYSAHLKDPYEHYLPPEKPRDVFKAEYVTLKEWNKTYRQFFETRINELVSELSKMRDLGKYDWSPLAHIFGNDIKTLTQLKTAMLQSELKTSSELLMQDYANFLSAVEQSSQFGAMRKNSAKIDSMLLGRYRVRITINDTGVGAKATAAVQDAVSRTTYEVNDTVDLVKDIGSGFKSLFRILFGGGT